MYKGKRSLSFLMIALFTLTLIFNSNIGLAYGAPAKTTTTSKTTTKTTTSKTTTTGSKTTSKTPETTAKPTIPGAVISGLKTSYKLKEHVSLKITSINTTLMVQYKIIVVNETTNDVVNVTKDFTTQYYKPTSPYTVGFTVLKNGVYTITVVSKLAGYKSTYSSSLAKKFYVGVNPPVVTKPTGSTTKPGTSTGTTKPSGNTGTPTKPSGSTNPSKPPVVTPPVTTPGAIVASIDPLRIKINKDDTYTLPDAIPAKMKDGLTKNVAVRWIPDGVDSSKTGVQRFTGKVTNYTKDVALYLTVVGIDKIDPINVTIYKGDNFELPQNITAKMTDGTTQNVSVKWNPEKADNTKAGVQNFTGKVDKYDKDVTLTLNVIGIDNIEPINARVKKDDVFNLPTTVTAKMTDGSVKNVEIKWNPDKAITSVQGEQKFIGKVSNYDKDVILTLVVIDESITSIDDITASVDEGKEYKLPDKLTAKIANGTIRDVDVKWNADSANTDKAGALIYEGTVDTYKPKVKLMLTVNPVTLALNSIEGTNLREIKLNFNKKVDKNSVKNDNLRLYKDAQLVSTFASLNSDSKTIILTPSQQNAFDAKAVYNLVIENIKDLNSNIFPRTIREVSVQDKDKPVLLGVSAAGPSTISLEFSEPIKDDGLKTVAISYNDKWVLTSPAAIGFGTNKIRVNLNSPMEENGIYDIAIKDFRDFAGNSSDLAQFKLIYKKDITPPAASVISADGTMAVIKFSKPVLGLTAKNFYHTNTSFSAIDIFDSADMTNKVTTNSAVDMVWVKFYDLSTGLGHPMDSNTRAIVVLDKTDSSQVVDIWGNAFTQSILPVDIVQDKLVPQVVNLKEETETTISVEFNKEVNLSESNIQILDEGLKKIDGLVIKVLGSGKRYIISLNKNLVGKNLSVILKNINDTALIPNTLSEYDGTLTIKDKTPPQVDKVIKKFVPGLEQSLYVYYNEPVNETATNVSNYYIQNPSNNNMVKLTEGASFYKNGNMIVVLSLTDDQRLLLESGNNLLVTNVCDVNSNLLPAYVVQNSKIINYSSSDNKPKVVKAQAVDRKTIVVTFNQKVAIDDGVFALNGKAPASVTASVNSDGNTVATIKCADGSELNGDLSGVVSLSINCDSLNRITNDFGVVIDNTTLTTTSAISIENNIPPMVKVVNGKQQVTLLKDKSGNITGIAVEYDKDINTYKLSGLSYSVEGREVTKVYTNTSAAIGSMAQGRFVIIELKPLSVSTSGTSVIVSQLLDIYDMNDNRLIPDGVSMVISN